MSAARILQATGYLRDLNTLSVGGTALTGALKQAKTFVDQAKG